MNEYHLLHFFLICGGIDRQRYVNYCELSAYDASVPTALYIRPTKILLDCLVNLLSCLHDSADMTRTEIYVWWIHGNMFSCGSNATTPTHPSLHWWQPNTRIMGVFCKPSVIPWPCYYPANTQGVLQSANSSRLSDTYISKMFGFVNSSSPVRLQTIMWQNYDYC